MRYEQIPHTSDIAIRAYGRTFAELLSNAAFGMFDIIADLAGLKKSESVEIALEAPSREELLVAWLDELLYRFYSKKIIFSDFEMTDVSDTKLSARVHGRSVEANKNRLVKEIKAVTFHDLAIRENKDGLFVEIVFDV